MLGTTNTILLSKYRYTDSKYKHLDDICSSLRIEIQTLNLKQEKIF